MLRSEADRLKRVIVCSPEKEYFRAKNLKRHNIKRLADPETAKRQHQNLISVLNQFGSEVIDISELDGHPNSVFTRDASLSTSEGFIQLRMGLETRRGEEVWLAEVLASIGEPNSGIIREPGTVEGGDVILAGSVAFVGLSERTNEEGVKQLSTLLTPMNYNVRVARMRKTYLHIGGAMSIIAHDRVLCCSGIFPVDYFEGFEKVEVPPDNFISGNVICLDDNEVVAGKSNNKVIIKLKKSGVIVHEIDLSEFVKGSGGPGCLVMPVEREN